MITTVLTPDFIKGWLRRILKNVKYEIMEIKKFIKIQLIDFLGLRGEALTIINILLISS